MYMYTHIYAHSHAHTNAHAHPSNHPPTHMSRVQEGSPSKQPRFVIDQIPQHGGAHPRGIEAQILHCCLRMKVSHNLSIFRAF